MDFLDFFSGVGGFRRGLELAGHRCIGFCEYDRFAVASYTSMHLLTDEQRETLSKLSLKQRQKEILKEEYRNGEWYANDIRDVKGSTVPRADIWCFGAPCQDFSIAGKRAGLDGDRSALVREVFRILQEIPEENRPRWVIYENVKGMLSTNGGADYLAILMEMDELGYDIEWQNINSAWFVPQNRERIYTVGHLRRSGAAKVLPIASTVREDSIPIEVIAHRDGYRRNTQVFSPNGITEALDTAGGGGRGHHTAVQLFGIDYCIGGREREVASAIVAKYDTGVKNRREGTAVAIMVKNATKKGYDEAHEGDSVNFSMPGSTTRRGRVGRGIAQTLDTQCSQGVIKAIEGETPRDKPGQYVELPDGSRVYAVWYEKYRCYIAIRKLTPRECFRLQGWDDAYYERAEFVNSDAQLYKQAGNGVTVNVVQAIGEKIGG